MFSKFAVSESGSFRASDYEKAEIVLILDAQKEMPYSDIELQNLDVYSDEKGILRSGGRLQNSSLPKEAIFPILLPYKSALTKLVFTHHHVKGYHSGVQATLASIRDSFWIVKGRKKVESVIRKCRKCKRFQAKSYKLPPYPPLPKSRVSPDPVFTNTGLDYLGPFFVKFKIGEEKFTSKVWVCIFTCLGCRALHLESVENLTSEAFINCLRRFIARRIVPNS